MIVFVLACQVAAAAEDYHFAPIPGMGQPLEQGVRIDVSKPTGWKLRSQENALSFILEHDDAQSPVVELAVDSMAIGDLNSKKKGFYAEPMHSFAVTWLQSASEVTDVKKLETFDAGLQGRLSLWRIRSAAAYNLYLVCWVRGNVTVEVTLRSDHLAELAKHKDSLKELVRSVRIVKESSR